MSESVSSDRRYAGDVSAALHKILGDTGARMTGSPQWQRDDDPELYDAILMIRDWIVRESLQAYPDELPFNIGNSYQRWVVSRLSSKTGCALFMRGYANDVPELVEALNVLDKRVEKAMGAYGADPISSI